MGAESLRGDNGKSGLTMTLNGPEKFAMPEHISDLDQATAEAEGAGVDCGMKSAPFPAGSLNLTGGDG